MGEEERAELAARSERIAAQYEALSEPARALVDNYERFRQALAAPLAAGDGGAVAFVGTAGYKTLEEAYQAAVEAGAETIVLAEGAEMDAHLTVETKVTLVFNNNTLNGPDDDPAFTVYEGGDLTLAGAGTVNGSLSGNNPRGILYIGGGTATLKDQVVLQNNKGAADSYGGGVQVNSGSFHMAGGVIRGTSGTWGGGVCVYDTFTMTGGTIEDTVGTDGGGGVALLWGASFEMSGGTIQNTSTSGNGGAVYLYGDEGEPCAFTLSGGVLRNTEAAEGGAVYSNIGPVTMTGGSIANTTAEKYGGAVYLGGGSFTMEGGTIQETQAISQSGGAIYANGEVALAGGTIWRTSAKFYGGAVYVGKSGSLIMTSGLIEGCEAMGSKYYSTGGAVYCRGAFSLSGGAIRSCRGYVAGGGVHMAEGSFSMTGGEISGCGTAQSAPKEEYARGGGGGVFVGSGAAFTLTDGEISGNTSAYEGGGVYLLGAFEMSGGRIADNYAEDENGYSERGGGVSLGEGSSFTMSGGVIAGNYGVGGIACDEYSAPALLRITGGAVYKNRLGGFPGYDTLLGAMQWEYIDLALVGEYSRYIDFDTYGNPDVDILPAAAMARQDDAEPFQGWKEAIWKKADRQYEYTDIDTALDDNLLLPKYEGAAYSALFYQAAFTQVQEPLAEGVYLDGSGGDDRADGSSPDSAVKTCETAVELALKATPPADGAPVAIYVCGRLTVTGEEALSLPQGVILKRAAGYEGYLVEVQSGGRLTLENITLDGNQRKNQPTASLVHVVQGGRLVIAEGTVLENNLTGSKSSQKAVYKGGAVDCEGGTVVMTGGVIRDNEAMYGGGVSVYNNGDTSTAQFIMTGGAIQNNRATYGGGVSVLIGGVFRFGPQQGEPAGPAPQIAANRAYDGGGIHVGGEGTAEAYNYAKDKQLLFMTGGEIRDNTAIHVGGGVFVQMNSEAVIQAGSITGNCSEGGGSLTPFRAGGIYVNGGKQAGFNAPSSWDIPDGVLQLYNVEVSNNEAASLGGGLAACPTAKIEIYLTDGGVFHDNVNRAGAAGTEIFIQPNEEGATSYVSDFMLGGGMYHWLTEGKDGEQIRPDQSYYQNTGSQVSLSNICAPEDVKAAQDLATTFITGNFTRSSWGGGIAANGVVIIGTAPDQPTAQIELVKSWQGEDGDTSLRPDSIEVDVRYGDYTLRDILLSRENGWRATLDDMPQEILSQKDPQVQVLEIGCDGYQLDESSVAASVKDDVLSIRFANSYDPNRATGALTVSKTVSGVNADENEKFNFIVSLTDGRNRPITGRYPYTGDSIPGVAAPAAGSLEFGQDGKAVFELCHGQSITVSGLPAGANYSVTESGHAGYLVTTTGEAVGTIQKGAPSAVAFENHKDDGGDEDAVEVTVKKVWKLDDGKAAAQSVTVSLLRDGERCRSVVLDEKNNWEHTWTGLESRFHWTVQEIEIPDGFTVSVSQNGSVFTLTNDDVKPVPPPDPDTPTGPLPDLPTPQTGDSRSLPVWISLLIFSGLGIAVLLVLGGKNRYKPKHLRRGRLKRARSKPKHLKPKRAK